MTKPDIGMILNRIKRGEAILLTDAIAAVDALDAEVAALAAAVAMAEAAQGRLNALVSDRDATIASLHKDIKVGALHVRRSEFDLAIATLEAALPRQESTIAQVDREAAAEYLPLADGECGECERGLMRSGELDSHWLPQAFARHRLAALRPTDGLVETSTEVSTPAPVSTEGVVPYKVVSQGEREAIRAEVLAEVAEWIKQPETVMKLMEEWHTRDGDGNLTDRTRENIGVALIFAQDAAKAIRARAALEDDRCKD